MIDLDCKLDQGLSQGCDVKVTGLSVAFGSRQVLSDISCEMKCRSLTSIIGPSGAGKSTFLTCINRLIDNSPGVAVTGKISIGGDEITGPNVDLTRLRRRVGMIFQKPNPFPTTIIKNLTLTLKFNGVRDRKRAYSIAEKALQEVGLWDEVKDRLRAPALALSGGQQQRLCIARAIAINPGILLLDEPCSALDPISTEKIEELLCRLRSQYTLVVVTHNLAQARRISERTLVFWAVDGVGKIIENGDSVKIFSRPASETAAAFIAGRVG